MYSDVENPMAISLLVLLLETAMSIQTPSPASPQSGSALTIPSVVSRLFLFA